MSVFVLVATVFDLESGLRNEESGLVVMRSARARDSEKGESQSYQTLDMK